MLASFVVSYLVDGLLDPLGRPRLGHLLSQSTLTQSRLRAAVCPAGTAGGGLGGTADSSVSVALGHVNDRCHPSMRIRHLMLG